MKTLIVVLVVLVSIGCSSQTQPVAQNTNADPGPQRSEKLQTVTAHTTENQQPPQNQTAPTGSSTGQKTKWSQGGNPIDTRKFDAAIAKAEKDLKSKPSDAAAKKALADSYFSRGFALTDARQYASALGDYRRALKYDPANEDAKNWSDQIISIYDSMNKQYPKEGEEPPPLPYKKGENKEK